MRLSDQLVGNVFELTRSTLKIFADLVDEFKDRNKVANTEAEAHPGTFAWHVCKV